MRVISSTYYNNIYAENNKLNRQLFDVNKQISSGQKIQYGHEDPTIFIDTMRLDNEITTLTQVKNSAQSAYKFSTQTDTTIGELVKTLESMKVKLVNAANDSHSDSSLQAIAKEMRGLKNHLMTLANSSIGGQFLFSGTATAQKPIDENGMYQGNNQNLEAFLGSGIKQKYNINGSQLFSGNENNINRTITANIAQKSLSDLYPDIMQDTAITRSAAKDTYLTGSNTIRDLMGDTDTDLTNDPSSHFYLQGTRNDGTSFKSTITMNSSNTIDDLMKTIADNYGQNQVNVTLNSYGQIEITDKKTGSSKLDFHMVGAVDFDTTNTGDAANIADPMYTTANSLDNLQPNAENGNSSTSNFENVINPTSPKLLYVKEFTKSGFDPSDSTNIIEGINYDRTKFEKEGPKLISNISQILKGTNDYAVPSTKLIDVAGTATLDTKQLILTGTDTGGNPFSAQIDFSSAGSTFSLDGGITDYPIYNMSVPRAPVAADEMTYQQLLDVVNMAINGMLPATTASAADYDNAISSANTNTSTHLDYAGRIIVEDLNNSTTKASLSMYDASSSDYSMTTGSAFTFNANSALSIRDPKIDFFTQIENAIQAVTQTKKGADGSSSTDPRNLGIQNSIRMMDDLSDHVSRLQTEAGSYSQVLQASTERTDMLIISTKTLQSDVIDTDIAESTLRLQQLSLNYQAMLSSISKVSQLSLVNYL